MTLRGNGGRYVTSLNELSGGVQIVAGTGIMVTDDATINGVQISAAASDVTLDQVLINGASTARTANFLKTLIDAQPSLQVGPALNFGPGGATLPDVHVQYSQPAGGIDGVELQQGKVLRADNFGAVSSTTANFKNNVRLDPGLQLSIDTVNPSEAGGKINFSAEIKTQDLMVKTIEADPLVGSVSFASPVQCSVLNVAAGAVTLNNAGVNAADVNVQNLVLPAPPAGEQGYMRIDSSAGQLSLIGSTPAAWGQPGGIVIENSAPIAVNTIVPTGLSGFTMDLNKGTISPYYVSGPFPPTLEISCGTHIGTLQVDALLLKNVMVNNQINTPSAGASTVDLFLNPTGNIVCAAGKVLEIDNVKSTSAGKVYFAENVHVPTQKQLQTDYVTNSDNTKFGIINLNPTTAVQIAPGKPLIVDAISSSGGGVTIDNLSAGSITGTASPLVIQALPGPGSKVIVNNLNCSEAVTAPGLVLPAGQQELKINALGDNPGSQQITLAAASVVIPYDAPLSLRKVVPASGSGMYFDLSNSLIAPTGTARGLTVNGISTFQNVQTNTFGADSVVTNVINTASGDLYLSPLGDINVPTNSTLKVDNIGSTDPDNVTFFRNGLSSLQPALLSELQSSSGGQVLCSDDLCVGGQYQLRADNLVNASDSTTGKISVNPTNSIEIAPGKPLNVDTITQTGLSSPLTLSTTNNQNINIYPGGTGAVYMNRPLYLSEIVSNAGLLVNSAASINSALAVNTITPYTGGSITLQAGNVGVAGGDVTIAPTTGGNIFLAGNTSLSGNLATTGSVIANTVRPQSGQSVHVAGDIDTSGNVTVGGDLVASNVFPITGNSVQVNGNVAITGNVVTNNVSPQSGNTVQINGDISTTGSISAPTDLNLAGNNINLNSSNVVVSGTLKADTLSTTTSTAPLALQTSGGQNILLSPAGKVVVKSGSTLTVDTITASAGQPITLLSASGVSSSPISTTSVGSASNLTLYTTGIANNSIYLNPASGGHVSVGTDLLCDAIASPGGSLAINCPLAVTGALTAASASCTGNVSAGSATCTGTITGGSLYTGALTASSASITGNIAGNNIIALTGVTTASLSGGSGSIAVSSQLNCNNGIATASLSGGSSSSIAVSSQLNCNNGIATATLSGGSSSSIAVSSQLNCNNGIVLKNGATVLNWYQESSITGTWVNATGLPSSTSTYRLCRLGSMIFVNLVTSINLFSTGSSNLNKPYLDANIPSDFRPAVDTRIAVSGGIRYYYVIGASTGTISIEPDTYGANMVLVGNFGYHA